VHELALDTRSPREAVRALCNTIDGFQEYLSVAHKDGIEFAIFRGLDDENITRSGLYEPAGGIVRIAAVPSGSKSGLL
jgi:predicted phage tail protein